ncbi:MAG: alpha/beta fold hydrolase [Pseudonocardiaceae bacterium]
MDLAYDRLGAGPPLVLLHGIGHRRQAWNPVLDRLAEHREVICVDLPGFGESPPLPDHLPYQLDSLITVLASFFASVGLHRPHVAGNSMGGFTALVLAQRGLARSATALSPAGLWTPAERRRALAIVRAVHRTALGLNPMIAARLAQTAAGRALLTGIIVARPGLLEPSVVLADMRALVSSVAFAPTLAAGRTIMFTGGIDVPVTIAWGSRDRILRRPRAELITRLIPQAQLLILPGCGHVPMSDDPDLVAQVLLNGSDDRAGSGERTGSLAGSVDLLPSVEATDSGDTPPLPRSQPA